MGAFEGMRGMDLWEMAGSTWGCWGDTVLSLWSGGRPGDMLK